MVEPVSKLETAFEEVELFVEMATEGGEDVTADLDPLVERLEQGIEALEFQVMLGGPNDKNNAYVQVSAGAGGVDSCDWAGTLLRMFVRWAERHRRRTPARDCVPSHGRRSRDP